MSQNAAGLVLVSAGLELTGGGTAAVSRQFVTAAQHYALARQVPFRVLHLGSESPTGGAVASHFGGWRPALALAVLRLQAHSPRPAILFDHLGPARIQAFLPRTSRSPYAVFLHGIEAWRPLTWDRRRALQEADLLLSNSEYTRARGMSQGNPVSKAEILPLALEEHEPVGTPDEQLMNRVGKGFLLILGRLAAAERYKGHDALLEMLPRLLKEFPGTRLVVCGEGDDRPRLEARAKALGLENAVTFTGFVSEATRAALYERCLALVMPSTDEGFGLVYLEAMRAARPCVALADSAANEIVVDGGTGLLVASIAEPLHEALACLLRDPRLADRLGAAGQHRWCERFSNRLFGERLCGWLDRLLEVA